MAVPEEMRGRVMGLLFTIVMSAQIGALFLGLLADTIGDRPALAIFGGIPTIALAAILVVGRRDLRTL